MDNVIITRPCLYFNPVPFCYVSKFYASHTAVKVPASLSSCKRACKNNLGQSILFPDTVREYCVVFMGERTLSAWLMRRKLHLKAVFISDSDQTINLNSDPFLCSCSPAAICVTYALFSVTFVLHMNPFWLLWIHTTVINSCPVL